MTSWAHRLALFVTAGQALLLGFSHADPSDYAALYTLAGSLLVWVAHELKVQPKSRAALEMLLRRAVNPPPPKPVPRKVTATK